MSKKESNIKPKNAIKPPLPPAPPSKRIICEDLTIKDIINLFKRGIKC